MAGLKGDLINGAFSMLRISGLTVSPTSEENALALEALEEMAQEFFGNNIDVGYNFEDDPDPNSLHNIPVKYRHAFKTNLAARIIYHFGDKELPNALARQVKQACSYLYSRTALTRQTQYPSRMPIGSGNSLRRGRYQKFYSPASEPPLSSATNKMIVGAINNFVEHFDDYLDASETIASFTIEADDGLTIASSSLSSPDVNYQIEAVGDSGTTTSNLYQVKIVATTSTGRVEPRLINFSLTKVEI